jgi:hypothetical protein
MRAYVCRWFVVPTVVLCLLPQTGRASVVTPDSIATPSALTLPAAHGVPVPPGGWTDQQYSGTGLWFFGAAVTQINGLHVWTPATDFGNGPSLNYAPGASIYVSFVDPVTQNAASTNMVNVEFTGVPPGRAMMTVFDGGPNGSATLLDSAVGPHGGGLISFAESGITGITLSRAFAGQDDFNNATNQPWGIAQIEIGDLTPLAPIVDPLPGPVSGSTVPAPEPGTGMLMGLAVLGLSFLRGVRRATVIRRQ